MNSKPTNNHSPLKALVGQASDAIRPPARYSPTPTTRNGDGFHRGDGKPTDGAGQWLLIPGAKLPPRAFEIHEKERFRFHTIVRSLPVGPDALDETARIGGNLFDASYGAEAAKFEREIDALNIERERITAERARLETDISAARSDLEEMPATVERDEEEPEFPTRWSAKWWGFALCLVLLLVSSGAAVLLIANLWLPAMQSLPIAIITASPWVLAAVAAEVFLLLTLRTESPKVAWALRAAVVVLIAGLLLWLTGLFPLAAPLTFSDATTRALLLPDRRWAVAGQLLCELAVSFLLLNGTLKLIRFRRVTEPNENRRRVSDHIAELSHELAGVNKELQAVLDDIAKPEGNLKEWENSRAAFIAEGTTIIRLREVAAAADEGERQRKAAARAENERLLQRFQP